MARVIIVDDQRIILQVLEIMVVGIGHTVVATCHDADDAMRKSVELEPDALILDLRLGNGRSGVEVLKHARAHGFTGTAIFVSAYLEKAVGDQLQGVDYDAFLVKPVAESRLKDVLSGAV